MQVFMYVLSYVVILYPCWWVYRLTKAQVEPGKEVDMRLWVDYTNHRGEREWREIQPYPQGVPRWGLYPNGDKQERAWVLDVSMVDREGALRTLKLENIHGFYAGYHPEKEEPT